MSNIFTFFAKGDVALSLAMTSLTNILAFITLPINLLMYTKPFRSSDVETPYIDILKSLLTVVLSIALGLVTRAKSERLAKIGVTIGSILGAITVVIIIVAGVVENFDAFSDPEVFPWTTPVVVRWHVFVFIVSNRIVMLTKIAVRYHGSSGFSVGIFLELLSFTEPGATNNADA